MHRRGVVFLLGFLVAIVVVGGSGVRAPWVAAPDRIAAQASPQPVAARMAVTSNRVRVE
jgi:hypothetical protein